MSFTLKALMDNFTLRSNDNHELGEIIDVYIDDSNFSVRYLVVDTHPWLPFSKKVLISPISVTHFDIDKKWVCLDLSKQQIKDCPSMDHDEPVSKEFETRLFKYFGYGYYWTGSGLWGDFNHPSALQAMFDDEELDDKNSQIHLRSANELLKYRVVANDDVLGLVVDFLFNQEQWIVTTMVFGELENLQEEQKLLCNTSMINEISWQQQTVKFDGDTRGLLLLPKFNPQEYESFN